MRPLVEIHIAISPTESFFQQVHYLAVSLRHRGGKLRDSPIIVTVGMIANRSILDGKTPGRAGTPSSSAGCRATSIGSIATMRPRYSAMGIGFGPPMCCCWTPIW